MDMLAAVCGVAFSGTNIRSTEGRSAVGRGDG